MCNLINTRYVLVIGQSSIFTPSTSACLLLKLQEMDQGTKTEAGKSTRVEFATLHPAYILESNCFFDVVVRLI